MNHNREVCQYCEKSYHSLIQHYCKSYCGSLHSSRIDLPVVSGRKRCADADARDNQDLDQHDEIFPDNSDINYALDDEGEHTEHYPDLQTVYYPIHHGSIEFTKT
jgi:hypothetical protein